MFFKEPELQVLQNQICKKFCDIVDLWSTTTELKDYPGPHLTLSAGQDIKGFTSAFNAIDHIISFFHIEKCMKSIENALKRTPADDVESLTKLNQLKQKLMINDLRHAHQNKS